MNRMKTLSIEDCVKRMKQEHIWAIFIKQFFSVIEYLQIDDGSLYFLNFNSHISANYWISEQEVK